MSRAQGLRRAIVFAGALLAFPTLSANLQVKMNGMKFDPPELELKRGDTVEWVNEDLVAHTATADKKQFDSGPIDPNGGTFRWAAKKRGVVPYHCTLHDAMTGKLVVK